MDKDLLGALLIAFFFPLCLLSGCALGAWVVAWILGG